MAENEVIEWIPSITDDYMVGKVTFTANSKDITFKDAFNGVEKSFTAGDSIYIPSEGRWLLLKEITSTTKGTLLYPCPESCAGTFDLRIRPLSRNARQAGLATMTLRNLNIGNLPGLAKVKLKTGQILVASQIDGSFDAKDLNADNVAETDKRKFITGDERLKLGKIKADLTAADIAETETRKIMTAEERLKLASIAGLEQKEWNTGKNTTESLFSPSKFLTALDALGVWRGGSRFGTASSGGFIMPNGMIVQYGLSGRSDSDYRLAFPMVFPTACAYFNAINAYGYDGIGGSMFIGISTSNISRDAADIRCRKMTAGGGVDFIVSVPVYWFAVGF